MQKNKESSIIEKLEQTLKHWNEMINKLRTKFGMTKIHTHNNLKNTCTDTYYIQQILIYLT